MIVFAPSGVGKEERPFEGYLGHKLSLNDPDSQRVGIGLTADGAPFLKFRGHDEKPRASLYVDSDGKPDFILWDEKTSRVLLGVRRSDTPSPQDNDWGLDFYPERAGIGWLVSGTEHRQCCTVNFTCAKMAFLFSAGAQLSKNLDCTRKISIALSDLFDQFSMSANALQQLPE